jgi:hypothetical protein
VPELKYSTVTEWIDNKKEQQHTTQHEPFLHSKLLETENTGLTPCSLFTSNKKMNIGNKFGRKNFRMTRIHNALSVGEVITLLHQLCVIKFAKLCAHPSGYKYK